MAEGDVELGHVDIDDTVQLLLKYDEEVQNCSKHHSGSICMVPRLYRDLSPSSFTPRVVSIGPQEWVNFTHLFGQMYTI